MKITFTIKALAFSTLFTLIGCDNEPQTLRDEAELAQEKLEDTREHAAEVIAEAEEDAVDKISDARRDAKQVIENVKEEARDMVRDAESNLTQKLNEIADTSTLDPPAVNSTQVTAEPVTLVRPVEVDPSLETTPAERVVPIE